jgi:hypothetical protein
VWGGSADGFDGVEASTRVPAEAIMNEANSNHRTVLFMGLYSLVDESNLHYDSKNLEKQEMLVFFLVVSFLLSLL